MVMCKAMDVVVVPFPFTDRPVTKHRPAAVVSAAYFNMAHSHKVLAMITSATSRWPSDVVLQDWQDAGLSIACWVRFKLFTLDDYLIVSKAGALSKRDAQAVMDGLRRCLAD